MIRELLPDIVREAVVAKAGERSVWLVGGAVRDQFLERSTDDFDFAVEYNAVGLARSVADELGAHYYTLDPERDAGRVVPSDEVSGWRRLDFAGLRAGSIEGDLRARDFTVNAMALRIGEAEPDLIDPTGGVRDAKDRRLRLCSSDALERDPIRALRAVRLAADLQFQLDGSVVSAVQAVRSKLEDVSVERLRDELFNILQTARPSRPLRVLRQLGLLELLLPSVGTAYPSPNESDPFALIRELQGLLAVIAGAHDAEAAADMTLGQASLRLGRFREQLQSELGQELSAGRSRRSLLIFTGLYAGRAAPLQPEDLPRQGRTLRLSGAEVKHIERIGHWLDANDAWLPVETDGRSLYRFYRQLGPAGVDVVLLALSRFLSASAGPPDQDQWEREVERAREIMRPYFEENTSVLDPKPLLNGDELINALDLEAGPQVGELLEIMKEAQAAGEVTSREEALELARTWLSSLTANQG